MNWTQAPFKSTNLAPNKLQIQTTPEEQPYYQMLYSQLDPNNTGAINGKDSVNFFKRSNIHVDNLKKIWIITSSNAQSLDQQEFYAALRLISYAQNGIEVSEQSLQLNIPAPLPQINGVSLPIRNTFQQDLKLQTKLEFQSPGSNQTSPTPAGRNSNNSQNNSQQDLSQYDISLDQYNKFEQFYFTQDTQNKGQVQGTAARELFFKSKLPNEQLKLIWSFCDTDTKGYLFKAEFIIALHLIAMCKKGFQLPQQLPDQLLAVIRGQKPSQQSQSQIINTSGIQQKLNYEDDFSHNNQQQPLNMNINQPNINQPNINQSNINQPVINQPPTMLQQAPLVLQQDANYNQLQSQQLDLQKKATEAIIIQYRNNSHDIIQQCVEEKKKEIDFLDNMLTTFMHVQTQLKKEEFDLHQQLKTLEEQKQNKQNQVHQMENQVREQLQTNQKLRQQVVQQTHANEALHHEQSTQNSSQSSQRPMSQGQVDHSFGQTYHQANISSFAFTTGTKVQPTIAASQQVVNPNQQTLIPGHDEAHPNMDDDFSDYQAKKQRIASNSNNCIQVYQDQLATPQTQTQTTQQIQISQLTQSIPAQQPQTWQSQAPQQEELPW